MPEQLEGPWQPHELQEPGVWKFGWGAGKIKQVIEENQIVMSKRPKRHFLSQEDN